MKIIPIREPAVKTTRISVSADFADNACSQGLDVCRAHLLIIASHLLETGRTEEAKKLTEAAKVTEGVARDIKSPVAGNANECAELNGG